MRRVTNFSTGSTIPAATLDEMQDEQLGLIPANGTGGAVPAYAGADGRIWQSPDAGVASGTLLVIDASVDWRSRELWGVFQHLTAADQRIGQANDWQLNDPTQGIATRHFTGPTGTGAQQAGGTAPANGEPPAIGTVTGGISYALVVDEESSSTDRVFLYADPSTGVLSLYNASASALHAILRVFGAGASPTAGTPPPDVIPTLTDVLWLTPGLAAARPSSPDGPYVYRATDTGDISLWDGGAWRGIGGVSSITSTEITDATTVGKALLTAVDAATARTDLGLGTAATHAATDFDAAGTAAAIAPSALGNTAWNLASATAVGGTAGGSAAASGGVASLTLGSATIAQFDTSDTGPAVYQDGVIPGSTIAFTMVCRVASCTTGTADALTNVGMYIQRAIDGLRYGVLVVPSSGQVFAVTLSSSSNIANTATGVFNFTGQGWFKLVVMPGTVSFFYGTGVGTAAPTSWTLVTSTSALATGPWTRAGCFGRQLDTSAGTVVTTFDSFAFHDVGV